MNELPGTNQPTGVQSQAPQAPAQASQLQAADPKVLRERAVEQIESIVSQTPANPFERAAHMQELKAAYIKARYGIDTKAKQ